MSIRYCTHCIMPETKPDLQIDAEGVCSACRYFMGRTEVDWDARAQELTAILDRYRCPDGSRHDCVVPVSGGKDSTYQIIRMLEHGMNPLCVTAATDYLTDIGRHNLENIAKLGVDHICLTPNPKVRYRINRIGLKQVGDICWPEHLTIFTLPVRVAVQHRIPLIVWGENSQNEYGGPAAAADNNVLNRRWLEEFGGLLGLRVSDLIGQEGITERDLILYRYPSDEQLAEVGVSGIFLGYYLPWDGWQNAIIAQAYGMRTYDRCVEGSMVNYENLDNAYMGLHDYFKFLKYGFGRATDLACMQVRRGRLSRADALTITRMHDGRFPWEYLGVSLAEMVSRMDLSVEEFITICDRFTNKRLFLTDKRGQLVKDAAGNLTKINYDNQ